MKTILFNTVYPWELFVLNVNMQMLFLELPKKLYLVLPLEQEKGNQLEHKSREFNDSILDDYMHGYVVVIICDFPLLMLRFDKYFNIT